MSCARRLASAFRLLALLAPVAGSGAAAQGLSAGSTFVLLSAAGDTVAVERFERSAERIDSELLFIAAGVRFTFSATLGPAAVVIRFENAFRPATADRESAPQETAVITIDNDTAVALISAGGLSRTQRLPSRTGAIPFLNPSFVLVEQIVRRALALGGDTVRVPVFAVQGGSTALLSVRRSGADSVVVDLGGVEAHLAVDSTGAILGGSVPAQRLAIVRSVALTAADLVRARPDYSAPAGAPYIAQEVRIPTDEGHVLAGTLTTPRTVAAPLPALITITGSGAQDRDESLPLLPGYALFREIADTLSRIGFAVLRMDDRGFGESGGAIAGATTLDFANDIRAAVRWLRSRPEIDSTRIALIGHSEGGIIAPMVAAEDRAIAGLILMAAPAWIGRRVIESQNRFLLERAPQLTAGERDSLLALSMTSADVAAAVEPWRRFFMGYDPLPTARRVAVPVLILHGETDTQVTVAQATELANAMRTVGNVSVALRTFPNTNHLFLPDQDGSFAAYGNLSVRTIRREVLGAIADWAREHIAR